MTDSSCVCSVFFPSVSMMISKQREKKRAEREFLVAMEEKKLRRNENEKRHLFKSLKPYRTEFQNRTPMEEQTERSFWNCIAITISFFLLLSLTIGFSLISFIHH